MQTYFYSIVKLRYSYRFYPSKKKQTELAKTFGCCRVVWNDALAIVKHTPKEEKWPSNGELQKICITQAKETVERRWLSEVSVVALQQSVRDLGHAFSNWFKFFKGERKGQRVGFPRFKKRDHSQSFRLTQRGFSIKDGRVQLAKIGEVKPRWSRPLPHEPSSVTVIKDNCNRYFLSFVLEVGPVIKPWVNEAVGVDLNIKHHALSTGERIKTPELSKLDRKVRRLKRAFSRKMKGSKRREKQRLQLARLQQHLANIRKDFNQKLASRLVNENQVICLEDLNVSGMVKNRKLSRAISSVGMRQLRTMVESKAKMIEGREVSVISRWEPTSQTCSDCGYRWGKLDLSVRELVCLNCGATHNRDLNAAVNIKQSGQDMAKDSKRKVNPCKTGLSCNGTALSTQLEEEQLSLAL